MSNRMEDFIQNNREEFDKFEPGPVVWHNIQQELKKPEGRKGILISMNVLRWTAAAAIVIVLGAGAYYLLGNKKNNIQVAKAPPKSKSDDLPVVPSHDTINETAVDTQSTAPVKKEDLQLAKKDDSNDQYNEELYHYARLVELKQNEIKKIKKDEPLLYQQFAGDFNKLDSTFHILKKQLPVNPNREQILEAMIQNLQYQEALLNQQLNIIKKINNTKKQAYEKAYRSA